MKTQIVKIQKAQALLGNRPHESRLVLRGAGGVFEVVWMEELDRHGLFYERDGSEHGASLLATHNNGHSCAALAERIISGRREVALAQLEFIRRCGGTAIGAELLPLD